MYARNYEHCFFKGRSLITVGRFSYFADEPHIVQSGEGAKLTVGPFCSIGENVKFYLGSNHRTDWATTYPFGHIFTTELGDPGIVGHPATKGDVTIGPDVWIAENATILSGVKIGPGAVVAGGALVVKDVLPYSIVGGNPSQSLKLRFPLEIINRLLALSWWDLPDTDIKEVNKYLCEPPTIERLDWLLRTYRGGDNAHLRPWFTGSSETPAGTSGD
jgi:acetyltransferase-like isoleucine patch superfamily enzyme